MVINVLTVLVCLLGSTVNDSAEHKAILDNLLQERSRVENYRGSIIVERKFPVAIKSRFIGFRSGSKLRLDHERIFFAKDRSEEGSIGRVVISGNDVLLNDTQAGATLEVASEAKRLMIDLRVIGLLPDRFANLPKELNINDTVVGQVAGKIERIERKQFKGQWCDIVKSTNEKGVAIEVFFDETKQFRGCGVSVRDRSAICWIAETKKFADTSFPSRMVYSEEHAGKTILEEVISLEEMQLNEPISDDTFVFSGIGVNKGDSVTVRSKLDNKEMVWDGKRLVEPVFPERPLRRGGYLRLIAGIVVVAICGSLLVRALFKR